MCGFKAGVVSSRLSFVACVCDADSDARFALFCWVLL